MASATGGRELPERPGTSRRGRQPDAQEQEQEHAPDSPPPPRQSEPDVDQSAEEQAQAQAQAREERDRTYAQATSGRQDADEQDAAGDDGARAEDMRRNLVSQRGSR